MSILLVNGVYSVYINPIFDFDYKYAISYILLYEHNYAIIVKKKGAKHYATYYAY